MPAKNQFISSPILDSNIVVELKIIMENEFENLYLTYLTDSEDKLQSLASAVEALDAKTTRLIAHSLKGSSQNVGAVAVSANCELLENAAREGDIDAWHGLLAQIENTFISLKQEIIDELLS